jgi:hypothetical protein
MSSYEIEQPRFRLSFRLRLVLFALIILGAVGIYLTAIEDPTRAWFNYLIGTCIFLGFGLFGLFFVLINNVTSASWSVIIRRIPEAMAMTLPVAALLLLGVFLGVHHLYEWSHLDVVAKDPVIQKKVAFLNEDFFAIRLIVYVLVWLGSAYILLRNSFRQDLEGGVKFTQSNYSWSAILLVLYALTVSMAGFDLLMSLEPHWFSTMYGVYFFAGFFQAGLATTYLLTWYLTKKGVYSDFVNRFHFHDLGKFVFAFSVFWAYIGFSQYMLYWYGNLPEETLFYIIRSEKSWQWVAVAMLAIRFLIPFFVLLPYANKMNFKIAVPVCLLLLLGQWVDVFWNAMPAARLMHHGLADHANLAQAVIGWKDVAVGLGFIALFFLVLGFILERIRLVPAKDPRLGDSIHHHG